MVPELLKGVGGTNKRKIGDPPSLRKQGFSIVIVLVLVLVLVIVLVVVVVLDFFAVDRPTTTTSTSTIAEGLRHGAG